MKRVFSLIAILAFALPALAQTPEEIISKMESELQKHKDSKTLYMVMDLDMPIVGEVSSTSYMWHDKFRVDALVKGETVTTWTDGKTEWTYIAKNNEIIVNNAKPKTKSATDGDVGMFSGITEGYDVTMTKETSDAWYFKCKKSKSNKDKDAPKTMDLAVKKGNYYPKSLSFKAMGISMTMRDISFDVTEKQATFDAANYPGATITDKR